MRIQILQKLAAEASSYPGGKRMLRRWLPRAQTSSLGSSEESSPCDPHALHLLQTWLPVRGARAGVTGPG